VLSLFCFGAVHFVSNSRANGKVKKKIKNKYETHTLTNGLTLKEFGPAFADDAGRSGWLSDETGRLHVVRCWENETNGKYKFQTFIYFNEEK
jgi:hypothetical protein